MYTVPGRVRGRYKAVVRSAAAGDVLRESSWGGNLITLHGFYEMLGNTARAIKAVVGTGNVTPQETDSTLTNFVGFSSTASPVVRTANSIPDVNGNVSVSFLYRWTFNPGQLGSSPLNLAEAGVCANITTPVSSTPIYSHGLLVDDSGVPTAVSYDPVSEYLDLYWELTFFTPAEISGTVTIVIDGVPTNFNYTATPMEFTTYFLREVSNSIPGWYISNTSTAPRFGCCVTASPRAALTAAPTGPYGSVTAISSAISLGDKSRVATLNCSPTQGNVVGGIKTVCVSGSSGGGGNQSYLFQIEYSPNIPKDTNHALSLPFTISLDNI